MVENWTFGTAKKQPTDLKAVLGGTTTLFELGWAYGTDAMNNGNITTHTIQRSSGLPGPLTQTFRYADAANRISDAEEGTVWSLTYAYDAFGNRAESGSGKLTGQAAVSVPVSATNAANGTSGMTSRIG